ncbi:hypothetical protein K458DRAFT_432140 [Lentithecium fluviatile CBS 122367]|uniref:Uncharacterized protein n=1 Tax=Lentithecium fluviatile CBS 122367 TaxID=1168545 RepID=A0A6G1IZC2_9PLEO|nr:hypothetical protein K458DRAFT_432140 [Lentithecium fluviatile CBS 122367]
MTTTAPLQEIYFAWKLRFVYGTQSVTMEEFKVASSLFVPGGYGGFFDHVLTPESLTMLREQIVEYGNNLSFITMSDMLTQKSQRPHNRIYAFQSLCKAGSRAEVNYDWTPDRLFNVLMDKLAETADNHRSSDIGIFANGLDMLPEEYALTLRRLSRRFGLSREEKEQLVKCYKTWAPRFNPACRGNEPWLRQLLLNAKDVWDLYVNGIEKPESLSFMLWSDLYGE